MIDPDFIADDELDFHDFGILDNYQIEKILYEFIENSYYLEYEKLLIISGKGKVVRPAVEKLLKKNSHVAKFKKAGYYNGQEGAFEVILKS
ncbi:MAG TPA: Smr/MutS family protein [Candidatus Dojkabacteria bacterium]|jgi:DNA-nicking Smr family endonuclease